MAPFCKLIYGTTLVQLVAKHFSSIMSNNYNLCSIRAQICTTKNIWNSLKQLAADVMYITEIIYGMFQCVYTAYTDKWHMLAGHIWQRHRRRLEKWGRKLQFFNKRARNFQQRCSIFQFLPLIFCKMRVNGVSHLQSLHYWTKIFWEKNSPPTFRQPKIGAARGQPPCHDPTGE